MLELNITEAVETLLVSIIKKSKRIEESERWLNSKLRIKGVESGGRLCYLGRSKGSSRGMEGGKDELHFDGLLLLVVYL